jgi:hypothetical protein
VAGFDRNRWPTSVGISGRIASESVAGFDRNPQKMDGRAAELERTAADADQAGLPLMPC